MRGFSGFGTGGRPRRLAVAALAVVAACGGAPATGGVPVGPRPAAAQETEGWSAELEQSGARTLPPVGYGTLSQDDITIALQEGNLFIKAVPLDEWVIRLTAPDTYRRLNGYKVARGQEILESARRAGERGWPQVFFVTFFTRDPESSYEPYDLQLRSQNFIYRPFDILSVTPDFGRERVKQQETQIALYLFPGEIDLDLPLAVVYEGAESTRWDGIRSRLDREMARVMSRAGTQGQSPP